MHGDSTVCVGVDVRQHPAIQRLSRAHLAVTQQTAGSGATNAGAGSTGTGTAGTSAGAGNGDGAAAAGSGTMATGSGGNSGIANSGVGNTRVLLSPFGLQATLVGAAVGKDADQAATILNEWSHFYPLPPRDGGSTNSGTTNTTGSNENCPPNMVDTQHGSTSGNGHDAPTICGSGGAGQLPSVVNVQVGSVRMKYPSAYVFVSETDEVAHGQVNVAAGGTAFSLGNPGSVSTTSFHKGSSTKGSTSPPRSILSAALASKDGKDQARSVPGEANQQRVVLKNLAPEDNQQLGPLAGGLGRATSGSASRVSRIGRITSRHIRNKAWADATSTTGLLPIAQQSRQVHSKYIMPNCLLYQ